MATNSSDVSQKAPQMPRLFERKSVREGLYAIVIYGLLIIFGAVVLMPMSWMISAALKGAGEPVYTIPRTCY